MGCNNSKQQQDNVAASGSEAKKKRRRAKSKRSGDDRTSMALAERSDEIERSTLFVNDGSHSTSTRQQQQQQQLLGEVEEGGHSSRKGEEMMRTSPSILRDLPENFQQQISNSNNNRHRGGGGEGMDAGRLTIHGPEDDYCSALGSQNDDSSNNRQSGGRSLLRESQRNDSASTFDSMGTSNIGGSITTNNTDGNNNGEAEGLQVVNPLVLVPSRHPPPGSESGGSSHHGSRKKLLQDGRVIEDQPILPFRPTPAATADGGGSTTPTSNQQMPGIFDPGSNPSAAASRTQSSGNKSAGGGIPLAGHSAGLSINSLPEQLLQTGSSPHLASFIPRGTSSGGNPTAVDQLSSRGSQGSKLEHVSASQRFDSDPLLTSQQEVYYLSALSTLNPRRDPEVREHLMRNYRGGCNHPTITPQLYLMTPDERRTSRSNELAKIHKVALQQQKYIDEGGMDCPKARKLGKKRNGILTFEGLLLIHPEHNEALPVAAFLPGEFHPNYASTNDDAARQGLLVLPPMVDHVGNGDDDDETSTPGRNFASPTKPHSPGKGKSGKEKPWRDALMKAIEASLTIEVTHRASLAVGSRTQEPGAISQQLLDERAERAARGDDDDSQSDGAEQEQQDIEALRIVKRTIKRLCSMVINLRSDLHRGDFDEVFRNCAEMRTFLFNSKTRATYLSGNSGRISTHLTCLKLALIQEIEVVIKDYQVLTNHAESFLDSLKASDDLENFQQMFLKAEFPNSPVALSASPQIPAEYKSRLNRFIATCLWDKVTYTTEALGIITDQELRVVRSKIYTLDQSNNREK